MLICGVYVVGVYDVDEGGQLLTHGDLILAYERNFYGFGGSGVIL